MPRLAAATIVSKRYLALARVTATSFRAHNPDVPFVTLLADEPEGLIDATSEPFDLICLHDLRIADPLGFRFQYGELELSYAATPFLIEHLLREGYDGVLFLKQETLVLDSLAPVFETLLDHSVLLTPHLLERASGDNRAAVERELNVLRAGVYNGGVVGFSNRPESLAVLAWWMQKTRRHCVRAVEEGLHFEQRWLDFVPSLAPHAHVLRDPGVNVGHWNLPERRIAVADGRVTANGVPCRAFRFSGYDPDDPEVMSRYNRGITLATMDAAGAVLRQYQTALRDAGHFAVRDWPYAYARFDNGVAIPDEARRVYRHLGDEAQRFGDPFATGHAGSFHEWMLTRQDSHTRVRR